MIAGLRHDRDRYVAFAFAAADILLECEPSGVILAAAGAAQTLCGNDPAGGSLIELVAPSERALTRRLLRRIAEEGRIDPACIRLHHASGRQPLVLLGGCCLPNVADRIFVTVTLMPLGLATLEDELPRDGETGLLAKDALFAAAARCAKAGGVIAPRQLTLLHLAGLADAARGLASDRAHLLMGEIGAVLRAESAGGDAAGRLGAEEFGLIEAKHAAGSARLQREIGAAAGSAGLAADAYSVRIASIDLSTHPLDERDAAKAIAYAVRRFSESEGEGFTLSSLQAGLSAAVASTAARFGDLRRLIAEGGFTLLFQPIVSLPGRAIHHYEALARFPDGNSPQEMIAFGEEVGLVEAFDLAVCRKAIAALDQAEGVRIAVNLSGRSAQSDSFREALTALLRQRPASPGRLIFELTESSAVERLDQAAEFLRWLKAEGYPVCLDDFGSGAAAYSYLRHFDVDFVKIDGPFLKAATSGGRERALIQSICHLCRDLGCAVVGEMIEDEAMLTAAAAMGIGLAQGWLFGRPGPIMAPPEHPAAPPPLRRARRRGAYEMWE